MPSTRPLRLPGSMSSHRTARIAEAIREVVSTAILFEMADPRVKGVTVLRAEVSGDLRNAVVLVSIMGTETEQNLTLRALQHAAGFLQSRVAARLQLRFTPALSFKLDESVKKSIAVTRLIEEARGQSVPSDVEDAEDLDLDVDDDANADVDLDDDDLENEFDEEMDDDEDASESQEWAKHQPAPKPKPAPEPEPRGSHPKPEQPDNPPIREFT